MKIERDDVKKLLKNISDENDVLSYIHYLEEELEWMQIHLLDLERENHCLRDEVNSLRVI